MKWWQLGSLVLILGYSLPLKAQIKPDSSAGTQVTPNVLIQGILSDSIDGGTVRGNNLFHSFSEFNIDAGRGVYFSNPAGISNIFTRVTGTNISNINGTLGVLGSANLFLLNPNGIVFGSGAKLDVQGSFIGTTAKSINFADGTLFSSDLAQPALLTVSVPVGLGFGSNPGAIGVEGTGHKLISVAPLDSLIINTGTNAGLQVQPGKTLALVGGDLNIQGGILTAEGGRIELGSVGEGTVSINPTLMTLGYTGVPSFRDIHLSQQALVTAGGITAGSIQVHGRQISINDASELLIQNFGINPGGDITVDAAESLSLSGYSSSNKIRSAIGTQTTGTGASGNITISTKKLTLQEGAAVATTTFSPARSGNLEINATERVQVIGISPLNPQAGSVIGSFTFFTGIAGDVKLSTERLSVLDGGGVAATNFDRGMGGSIYVNAGTVEVIGKSLILPSNIASVNYGSGSAGNVTIDTRTLSVRDGGAVSTSSASQGPAGSVMINASKSVEVLGIAGSPVFSSIDSSVLRSSSLIRLVVGLPEIPSGASGDVLINTPTLKLNNGAVVAVTNQGVGNGGNVKVKANTVLFDNQSSFNATTFSGQGGNISLRAQNLQLRHNSAITTNAGSTDNGGNITLDVGAIAQLENSNITANAVKGRGGNIQITTRGIFQSLDSKITASSELGISGQVQISNPDVKQQNNLLQQPSSFVSAEKVVATSCLATRNIAQGRFVVTGQGGLPETPNNKLELPYSVVPVSTVIGMKPESVNTASVTTWKLGDNLQEATQLVASKDGHLLLQTTPAKTSRDGSDAIATSQSLTCGAKNQ